MRDFKSIVEGIKTYVSSNPATTTKNQQNRSNVEEYVPPGINLDELSSSQQEKLRQRGVIHKISKKDEKKDRVEHPWVGRDATEVEKRRREREQLNKKIKEKHKKREQKSNKTLSFVSNKPISQQEIWKILQSQRIFIRNVSINDRKVEIQFANEGAAKRANTIIQTADISDGLPTPVDPPTPTDKPSIFDRLS